MEWHTGEAFKNGRREPVEYPVFDRSGSLVVVVPVTGLRLPRDSIIAKETAKTIAKAPQLKVVNEGLDRALDVALESLERAKKTIANLRGEKR